VSFKIETGESAVIIGRSGSGKKRAAEPPDRLSNLIRVKCCGWTEYLPDDRTGVLRVRQRFRVCCFKVPLSTQ